MSFVTRNFKYTTAHPRHVWSIMKTMNQYAREHPFCEITGKTPITVHHIIPVHIDPEKATDLTNMISLARGDVHKIFGHGGNWKWYVRNILEIKRSISLVKNEDR